MLGVLKAIFGSGEVIKEGFQLIDDMHTSDEERIEARADNKVRILQAYEPFKLAQRLLAVMFTITFLFSFLLVLGMTLSGQGNPEAVKQILAEFWIGEIMLTIVLFYFGGGAAEGVIAKIGARVKPATV